MECPEAGLLGTPDAGHRASSLPPPAMSRDGACASVLGPLCRRSQMGGLKQQEGAPSQSGGQRKK